MMMTSLAGLRSKSPLIRQIREPADGTGFEAMSDKTCAVHVRIHDALGESMLDFYEAVLKSNNAPQVSASLRANRVKTTPSKFLLDLTKTPTHTEDKRK
jgi:hypothetical protein